jgi:hypothetical protein
LYPLGKYDNWQVVPFLKGKGDTGKGTILSVIKQFFAGPDIAALTATQEQKFGLHTWINKRVVIGDDIPQKMSKVLDQTIFQSMASSDSVQVPRKNMRALTIVKWLVALLLCGNQVPDWLDASGSVSRRFGIFLFETTVTRRDTTIKDKIKTEVPAILLKCLHAYRKMVEEGGSRGFYDSGDLKGVACRELHDSNNQFRAETSPITDFLREGNDEVQIELDEKGQVLLRSLKEAFHEHCSRHNIHNGLFDKDAIEKEGYTLKKLNCCKTMGCGAAPSTKETCRDHYNKNSRRQQWFVMGMKMTRLNQAQQPRQCAFPSSK